MKTKLSLLVATVAALACASPASAQVKAFGAGFDGWNFTATKEGNVTNCRAFRKIGGRDDIVGLRTNGMDYVSVRAEGRKGRWADSTIVPFREPPTGLQYDGLVEANGIRMWIPVNRNFIEIIMQRGGYDLHLGGSEDGDRVPFGGQGAKAFIRLKECIVANRG